MNKLKNIAVFASGSGSNAINIYNYFKGSKNINVKFVVTNNYKAGVVERFENLIDVETIIIKNSDLSSKDFIEILSDIDLIVLAGFLCLIPSELIDKFENKIINIHPSLLPLYGGKGMYGDNVHKKVLEDNAKQSGITIHYVDKHYDTGNIITQKSFDLSENENLKSLKSKINELEMQTYPEVIKELLL